MTLEAEAGVGDAAMTLRVPRLLVALSLLAACAVERPLSPEPLPKWLTSLIRELETQPVANPPAFIARYDYQRRVVYYLPARCCDIYSNLYGANGAILCHPDGGLAGGGDAGCPDFFDQRKNEEIIWRDPRGVT